MEDEARVSSKGATFRLPPLQAEVPPHRLVLIYIAPSKTPRDVSTDDPSGISMSKPDTALTSLTPLLVGFTAGCDAISSSMIASSASRTNRALRLHFLFLIVECRGKGYSVGSSMVVVQNQTADGACALNILCDLQLITEASMPYSSRDHPMSV